MKRFLFLLLSFLSFWLGAKSQQISESEAKKIAQEYMGSVNPVSGLRSFSDTPAFYVFNKDNGGFIIVSADSRLTKIVGYSNEGNFSPQSMPDELTEFLKKYTSYVEDIRNSRLRAVNQDINPIYIVVEPILKTKWDQQYPYNIYTPKSGNKNTPTGCVATAITQVMYHYKWPNIGKQTKNEYKWGEMSLTYDNKIKAQPTESEKAVARLMSDVGVAMKMRYGPKSSGTYTEEARTSFPKYFDYDVDFVNRSTMPTVKFIEKLKSELDAGKPIVFDGAGSGGGHAWVVDGYDSNGFVHCNWGWSGISNGFFNINYMDPDVLGTGGGSGGFANDQHFMVLTPNRNGTAHSFSGDVLSQRGEGEFSQIVNGSNVLIYTSFIYNHTEKFFNGDVAIRIKGTNSQYEADPTSTMLLSNRFLNTSFNISNTVSSISDGDYTISLVCRKRGETTWKDVLNSKTLTMTKRGTNISFPTNNDPILQLTKAPSISADKVYIGAPLKIKLNIQNLSNTSVRDNKLVMKLIPEGSTNSNDVFLTNSFAIYDGIEMPYEYDFKVESDRNLNPGRYRVVFEVRKMFDVICRIRDFEGTPFYVELANPKTDATEPNITLKNLSLVYENGSKTNDKKNTIYIKNHGVLRIIGTYNNDGLDYNGNLYAAIKDITDNKVIGAVPDNNVSITGEKDHSIGFRLDNNLKVNHKYQVIMCLDKNNAKVKIPCDVNCNVFFVVTEDGDPDLQTEKIVVNKNGTNSVTNDNLFVLNSDRINITYTICNKGVRPFKDGFVRLFLREPEGVRNYFLKDIAITEPININSSVELSTGLMNLPEGLKLDQTYEIIANWVFEDNENKIKNPSDIHSAIITTTSENKLQPNLSLNKLGIMNGDSYVYNGNVVLKNNNPISIELSLNNIGDADYNGDIKVYWQEEGSTEKNLLGSATKEILKKTNDVVVTLTNLYVSLLPQDRNVKLKVYWTKYGANTELVNADMPTITPIDEFDDRNIKVYDKKIFITSRASFKKVFVYDLLGKLLFSKLGDMNDLVVDLTNMNIPNDFVVIKIDNNTKKLLVK